MIKHRKLPLLQWLLYRFTTLDTCTTEYLKKRILLILPLLILQRNSQFLIAYSQKLKHYIHNSSTNPDVICIQETWLKTT